MNETAFDGRFNNLTDLTERKRSKKKEDTTTAEYYLKFSFFGLDKWEYLRYQDRYSTRLLSVSVV